MTTAELSFGGRRQVSPQIAKKWGEAEPDFPAVVDMANNEENAA
jgi:hypothetical protein